MIKSGLFTAIALTAASLYAACTLPTFAADGPAQDELIVHEWGTFTSVAGADGEPVVWFPLTQYPRLPDFVHTTSGLPRGLALTGPILPDPSGKGQTPAIIRMETPVLYFYSELPTHVSVQVDVPDGNITEWYPQADELFIHDEHSAPLTGESIYWGDVVVSPHSTRQIPGPHDDNHYFAARQTDSAVLSVARAGKLEQEKFLFYRGLSFFDQPLRVSLDSNQLHLSNTQEQRIPALLVLHSDGKLLSCEIYGALSDTLTVDRPRTLQTPSTVRQTLIRLLIADGLFPKEAQAMVDTWEVSWLDEGLRVLYLLPRAATDAALPLTIQPAPTTIERVMVGRIEVITPEQLQEVTQLLEQLDTPDPQIQLQARTRLFQLGRFLNPIMNRILEDNPDESIARRINTFLSRDGC